MTLLDFLFVSCDDLVICCICISQTGCRGLVLITCDDILVSVRLRLGINLEVLPQDHLLLRIANLLPVVVGVDPSMMLALGDEHAVWRLLR